VSRWAKTCRVCGILAPNHCGRCKVVNYCCRVHQVYDWKNGHKNACGTEATNGNGFLFPEYEIVIERDDTATERVERNDPSGEQTEMEKYNAMIQDGKAGTFQNEDVNDDLLQMANDEKDETFAEFRTKIDSYPDQILRYHKCQ
ncbi:PREDICTED: programmed cell death protein 2-like, partial [Wasmannia auropunctata]|uniref:programmed cell death protein 2-like n=1 Tax=Wasmannia auropunctata TaxID=64793 RepID=UPI0005EF0DB7